MKKFNFLVAGLMFLFLGSGLLKAQNSDNPWYIGIGMHAVDHTSVRGFGNGFFDYDDYSIVPPLSKLTIARNLNNSFAVDLTASIGEIDNNRLGAAFDDEFFINAGLGLRYRFANGYILNESSWFDPYLRFGANYHRFDYESFQSSPANGQPEFDEDGQFQELLEQTVSGEENHFGLAGGIGINFWITKNFAFNVATDYNYIPESQTDYFDFFQHSAGIAFRFGGDNDKDDDGILDDEDDCPETPGVVSSVEGCNGCPDGDGDGLCDAKDECPTEAGPISNNGCPEPVIEKPVEKDSDGDGILDKNDDCPNTPGVASSTPGCNGCPDKDGDGICDSQDPCPDNPKNDCKLVIVTELENVNFDYNTTNLVAASQSDLTKALNVMKEVPASCFKIGGHTDSKGSATYNQGLSERRANAIVDYIVGKGISRNRMKAVGYGEAYPVRPNDTDAGRAANRRVEFIYSDCNTWAPKAIGLSDGDAANEMNRLAKKIYFQVGSSKLLETSQLNLDIIAEYLKQSKKNWEVGGHTDNTGNDDSNLKLSQDRAQSVVDYLVGKGVSASKLTAKGYGETSPVDTNDTKAGRANNRRIEFK